MQIKLTEFERHSENKRKILHFRILQTNVMNHRLSTNGEFVWSMMSFQWLQRRGAIRHEKKSKIKQNK